MTEVTNKCNAENNKNNLVVDTEDWHLTMNVYMRECENHMRDTRQQKVDTRKIYNLVLQHSNHGLNEELKTLNKRRTTEENQDLMGILMMTRELTHGLKQKTSGRWR